MQGVTITLEELIALRYAAKQLNLPQQNMSSHSQQGSYHSPFRGRGMDFVEMRIYQPGDDIRNINWAVTARTGKAHTKIYQQERERPVYLIVDFSPSMFFGTRRVFKSVLASEAAALLAWSGIKNGDRIGALLLKEHYQLVPPCQKKQNIVTLLKELVTFAQPGDTSSIDYLGAFKQLKKIIKTGSLIYFLSDFYFLNKPLENELRQLSRHNEVRNIFIYDPLERTPPDAGRYLFRHPATADSFIADTYQHAFNRKYKTIFDDRLATVKELCFATGMHLTELSTNDDLLSVMRQAMNRKN